MLGPVVAALVALASQTFESTARAAGEAPRAPAELLTRIEAAWRARDIEAYLGLWLPGSDAAVADERQRVGELFTSEQCSLELGQVGPDPADATTLLLNAHAFCVHEPSGTLLQARYRLRSSSLGWHVVARETLGPLERFVHIELSPAGFRADGRTLRFEDFELRMERGTLFLPPESIGATALVFVGAGTIRFTPRPDSEQEQLRQFCGHRELVARVKTVSVRLNPNDLEQVLTPAALEPDPASAGRWHAARQAFEEHGTDDYRLDINVPGSPWWTFPLPGKAVVVFRAHRTTLAYGVSVQPESLSLFDRTRRRHICMYRASQDPARYYEDEANGIDILHHDLHLRLEPARSGFEGKDTLRLRLRSEAPTVYLRLAGELTVRSVTSPRWGSHLFFRSASRGLLIVALGGLVRAADELTLTVTYSGKLAPAHTDTEAPEAGPGELQLEREVDERAPKLYTNEPVWYPQAQFTDYATSRLVVDVPEDYEAVSGGERVSARVYDKRLVVEYRQDAPSRYLGLVVGRLSEVSHLAQGSLALRGFGMPQTRSEVPELIRQSARIVQFFETLYGPCPYPVLNVVFVEGLMPGGHGPPGMTIVSRRSLLLRRLAVGDPGDFSDIPGFFLAHELAHQWWGHGVAPANYRERWLSEAQAHYAAALWVQHTQGDRAFRQVLDRMAGWAWRENGQGPIGLGQRLGHARGATRVYRAIVYDKGALVLHMLRGILGDDAFFGGLRRFSERCRFRTATTDDLRQEWEAASGQDLRPYLDRWVGDTTLPRLRWSYQTRASGQAWRTTVRIVAADVPGPLPLAIAAELPDAVERMRVLLPPAGGTYTIETRERPDRVRINDDRGLLARVETGR